MAYQGMLSPQSLAGSGAATPQMQQPSPGGPQMPPMPNGGTPPQQMEQGEQQDQGQEDQYENYLDYALSHTNLAKRLRNKENDQNQDVLTAMGQELCSAIDSDDNSRQDWMEKNKEWLKLAMLVRENKTWPWPKASNVKYPLIATAAMQFSARAYPALVPSDGQIVKARVSKRDKQGIFQEKAIRVALHMSYQVLCKIPNWEEEMDKLLMTMAVSGICFKKTYHNDQMNCHYSQLVYPENLIINYYAKSLEKAYRKTEVLYYTQNEVKEKVENNEEFLDVDLTAAEVSQVYEPKGPIATRIGPLVTDKATPHTFYCCHTYWDLDEDGYAEPYVITIHKATRKVVRIVARWDQDGVIKDSKDNVIKITPIEYFTDFPFIPNPDGSIYAMGFGMLLAPLNEAANSLINQLIDAGTLNNLGGGFISKSLRVRMGQLQLMPGEWKAVNATGDDLQKGFFPNPSKEPSGVLFELLNMLITSGNQLASIAEIFVGKMPGQNTTATTTQETIQQGMAVFTAIYKRVYRSLHKEFKKIFRLNKINPGMAEEESQYVDEQLQVSDYQDTENFIIPGADPTGDSNTVKMAKLQQIGQLLQLGTINPMVFTQRMLEANDIPNYQELIVQPQPQEDPKVATEKMKQQTMQQKAQLDSQAKQQDMQLKERIAQLDMQMKALELRHKEQLQAMELQGKQAEMKMDMILQAVEGQHEAQQSRMEMERSSQEHELAMSHTKEMNQVKVQQAKQKPKAKPGGTN